MRRAADRAAPRGAGRPRTADVPSGCEQRSLARRGRLCPPLTVLTLLWLVAGALTGGSPLSAQRPESGGAASAMLPESVQQIDGFRLAVQIDGLDEQPGYLPLRVTATAATGTFPADRTVTVVLDPVLRWGDQLGREATSVRLDLTMRQGQSVAVRDLYVPRWSMHGGYRVRVSQQGMPLTGYHAYLGRSDRLDLHATQQTIGDAWRTGVILPREVESPQLPWQVCPDLAWMKAIGEPWVLTATDLSTPLLSARQRIAALRSGETSVDRVFAEDQLPTDWRGYDALDILLAPLPLLERMAEQQPAQWRALRQWLSAGGNVWVYAAQDRQRLAELLETSVPATTADDPVFAQVVETFDPAAELLNLKMQADRTAGGPADPYSGFITSPRPASFETQVDRNLAQLQPAAPLSTQAMADLLWVQPYLAGQVIALADPQPFPGDLQIWNVARRLTQHRASTLARRGVDVTGGSSRFWNWVLPDVARPPVYRFLALLAVFAIMVGPVAYRRTTRAGRPYLMFLIAPVLAFATTILMFGYGLIADGLGTQTRIRQITWLDGTSGHAVRWARGTYFAALRLPDGLHFPADAAVFPYPQHSHFSVRRGGTEEELASTGRFVTLTENRQHLSPSFLPSRTQRQFVSLQPIDGLGQIALARPAAGADQTQLRNLTTVEITAIVARDAQGDYWLADQLPAGGTATAVRALPPEASSQLRTLFNLQPPEPPLGFDTRNRRLVGGDDWLAVVLRENNWDTSITDGLFEQQLRVLTQLDAQLPWGSFLAVAEATEDALAVDDAKMSDSIHYVIGSLP